MNRNSVQFLNRVLIIWVVSHLDFWNYILRVWTCIVGVWTYIILQVPRRADGRTGGLADGWTDGRADGRTANAANERCGDLHDPRNPKASPA